MDLKTYAAHEGISVQRASQLARSGKIVARKTAGRWVIEQPTPRRTRPGRSYSQNTRDDVVAYLHRRTLEVAPPGYRRGRLAARIRELRAADNPAQYLRDMFAEAPVPEGPGGAAIVRAAMRGLDDQVQEVVLAQHDHFLTTPAKVAAAIRDERMLQRLSRATVAAAAGIPLESYTRLEARGASRLGNIDGRRVMQVLGIRAPKIHIERMG